MLRRDTLYFLHEYRIIILTQWFLSCVAAKSKVPTQEDIWITNKHME